MLAHLHRAGDLAAVYVPRIEDEALRALSRAREDAKGAERKAHQQLKAFVLRHGVHHSGKTHWRQVHWRGRSDIRITYPAQQITRQAYVDAMRAATERVQRYTERRRLLGSDWRLGPVVEALQALRGVSLLAAVTEGGRTGRHQSLRPSPAVNGLLWARSHGAFTRRVHAAGIDHQDRQQPCPAQADRSGLVVPAATQGQPKAPGPTAVPPTHGLGDSLEGSTEVLCPVEKMSQQGETGARRRHRHG
jgi:hypothetical protein